jgi:sensor c-di-GMP phosphodiesterase-like protein
MSVKKKYIVKAIKDFTKQELCKAAMQDESQALTKVLDQINEIAYAEDVSEFDKVCNSLGITKQEKDITSDTLYNVPTLQDDITIAADELFRAAYQLRQMAHNNTMLATPNQLYVFKDLAEGAGNLEKDIHSYNSQISHDVDDVYNVF